MAQSAYHGGYQPHGPLSQYATNALALTGGLEHGELFCKADGTVAMVMSTTTTTTVAP